MSLPTFDLLSTTDVYLFDCALHEEDLAVGLVLIQPLVREKTQQVHKSFSVELPVEFLNLKTPTVVYGVDLKAVIP